MQQKHRINMSQQSIENEKDVAQERESTKRRNRRHAETRKNAERRKEAEEVDPRHVVISLWLVSMSAGVRQGDRRAGRRNRASDGSPRMIRDYDKPTSEQRHRAVKNEKCEPPMSEGDPFFRALRAESAPPPNVSRIRSVELLVL